jgi:guanylate kinase
MSDSGNLYVISAPSGTGKTTLVTALTQSLPHITVSISHTTRKKRPLEVEGADYYFIEPDLFTTMINQHDFLEHAVVFDNCYGTCRHWVKETLERGIDVILEIDWQGCLQIQKLFPNCISIFVLPPSLDALAQRLIHRNQDNPQIIAQRLMDVRETTKHVAEYNYIVINDDFNKALSDLQSIVLAGRLVKHRQLPKLAELITDLSIIQM